MIAKTTTLDPRRGLPSASSLHRLRDCPGSWQLESTLPEQPAGEDAERGTRIHAWLAGDPDAPLFLVPEEQEIADACVRIRDAAMEEWSAGGMRCFVWEVERRFWLELQPEIELCSGQPDIVYSNGGPRALVLDYKTGRIPPDPAEINLQLRALAVMVAEAGGFREVSVGIVQPWVSGKVDLITYTADDLRQAKEEIIQLILASTALNAPRKPSPSACQYCRASGICPEARQQVTALATLQAHQLTPQRLSEALDACSVAEKVIAAIRAEARSRIDAGDAVPGWELKPGVTRREITNPMLAWEQVQDVVPLDEFMQVISVPVGKLETLYAEHAPAPTKKAAKEQFNELLAPAIETKQNAPSLARRKENT